MSAEAAASVPPLVWLTEEQLSRKDFPRTGKHLTLGYHMSHVHAFRSFYEQAVPKGLFLLSRENSARKHTYQYCIVPASLTYEDFWRAFEFHEDVWCLMYPGNGVPFVEKVVADWRKMNEGSSKWEPMAAIMLDVVFSGSEQPSPDTPSHR